MEQRKDYPITCDQAVKALFKAMKREGGAHALQEFKGLSSVIGFKATAGDLGLASISDFDIRLWVEEHLGLRDNNYPLMDDCRSLGCESNYLDTDGLAAFIVKELWSRLREV